LDIVNRKLNIIGFEGKRCESSELEKILAERKVNWRLPEFEPRKGIFKRYTDRATSAMKGAYLE
jgi:dihydroxy-acid dehydratase